MKHAALQASSSQRSNVWEEEEEEGGGLVDERQSLMESERLQQQHMLQEELEFERVNKLFSSFAHFCHPTDTGQLLHLFWLILHLGYLLLHLVLLSYPIDQKYIAIL